MNYAERLKIARKQKKLSQDKLEKATNGAVKQGTISKIERGDQETSTFDVPLAIALDVHPKWLKDGDLNYAPDWLFKIYPHLANQVRQVTEKYQNNISGIAKLNENEQKMLMAFSKLTLDQQSEKIAETIEIARKNKQIILELKDKLKNEV